MPHGRGRRATSSRSPLRYRKAAIANRSSPHGGRRIAEYRARSRISAHCRSGTSWARHHRSRRHRSSREGGSAPRRRAAGPRRDARQLPSRQPTWLSTLLLLEHVQGTHEVAQTVEKVGDAGHVEALRMAQEDLASEIGSTARTQDRCNPQRAIAAPPVRHSPPTSLAIIRSSMSGADVRSLREGKPK